MENHQIHSTGSVEPIGRNGPNRTVGSGFGSNDRQSAALGSKDCKSADFGSSALVWFASSAPNYENNRSQS